MFGRKGMSKGREDHGKRTVAITVRMHERDAELFEDVKEILWPDALMTKSAIILSLARMCAKGVVAKKKKEEG